MTSKQGCQGLYEGTESDTENVTTILPYTHKIHVGYYEPLAASNPVQLLKSH